MKPKTAKQPAALGQCQEQALAFIRATVDRTGYAPTIRQIATACGGVNANAAHQTVRRLARNGHLELEDGRIRLAPTAAEAGEKFRLGDILSDAYDVGPASVSYEAGTSNTLWYRRLGRAYKVVVTEVDPATIPADA